ncbi:MAG: hypothetical protein ABW075_04755 [Aeromicrobium sp.]
MRWDRLFDDLEAQAADIERDERDALVDELRDGDWADTTWRQLLGGTVVLEVLGAGRIEGEVTLANEHVVQVAGDRIDHVVAVAAVTVVHAAERRADPPGRVASALGWGHVFRALRDAGEPVTVRLVDGTAREGVIEVVGRDFVRLATTSGRAQDVVWTAVSVVSGRR